MSSALSAIGFLVFFSALRVRLGTEDSAIEPRQLRWAYAGAAMISSLVWLSADQVLALLEVSAPTLWVGAGLVIAVASLVGLSRGVGNTWAVPSAPQLALVPLMFPLLLSPELVVHSLAAGADRGIIEIAGMLLAAIVAYSMSTRSLSPRLAIAFYRFQSLIGVLLGVVWLVEGSRSLIL